MSCTCHSLWCGLYVSSQENLLDCWLWLLRKRIGVIVQDVLGLLVGQQDPHPHPDTASLRAGGVGETKGDPMAKDLERDCQSPQGNGAGRAGWQRSGGGLREEHSCPRGDEWGSRSCCSVVLS